MEKTNWERQALLVRVRVTKLKGRAGSRNQPMTCAVFVEKSFDERLTLKRALEMTQSITVDKS